jgi:hypothetical protein
MANTPPDLSFTEKELFGVVLDWHPIISSGRRKPLVLLAVVIALRIFARIE